ncbi:MFS transporter [Lactobacillaceae bacterium L1_55_11]|nr:MFS transporter [Lactobacillaceae bacterium L1_55_11]
MAQDASKNAGATLPQQSFKFLMYMSAGIFGTQMAFALESAQLGRLLQTIGASRELLGIIFVIPPLAGLLVQPLVGKYSDLTWLPKLGGRRLPYLIIGSIFTMLTLILLPNVGSFGWTTGTAVAVATIILGVFMVASNVCIQPYKMLAGDMVNEQQRGQAYSVQSFLANAGTVVATVAPFALTLVGVPNTAPKGQVPPTVAWAFYIAAAAIGIFSLVTVSHVREYDPTTYDRYHGLSRTPRQVSMVTLLKRAPRIFWVMALVQFFAYLAFGYLWVYGAGTVAHNVFGSDNPDSAGYQMGGNLFGILSGLYALTAVGLSFVLARLPKKLYATALGLTLMVGGGGLALVALVHNQAMMFLAFILVGVGWSALSVYPLTYVTDAVDSQYMGTYLGLFNAQICIPQILGSVASVVILPLFKQSMPAMIAVAAVAMVIAALATLLIRPEEG